MARLGLTGMGRRVTLARGKRSRKDGAAKEGKPQQFHFRNRYIMATETQAVPSKLNVVFSLKKCRWTWSANNKRNSSLARSL